MRVPTALCLIVLLVVAPGISAGDRAKETDKHVIYYNAIQTSTLPEEVARAYNITRSDNRVLLNIAVHRRNGDNGPVPVEADIEAEAVNLNAQMKRFRMEKISEDEAIYYIGTTRISSGETLDFSIRVQPRDSDEHAEIHFRRQY